MQDREEIPQMEDNNNNKSGSSNNSKNRKAGGISWGVFMIIVLIGFALIMFLVLKIYPLLVAHFGWKVRRTRAIPLLIVAFLWYVWGQVCIYIKNEYDID